jgi:hypothetical protein
VSDEKAVIFFDDSGKSETALGPMAIAGPLWSIIGIVVLITGGIFFDKSQEKKKE